MTLSIKVKEGSSRTVVGAEAEWSCCGFGGIGMLDAESINFYTSFIVSCVCISNGFLVDRRGGGGGS